MEPPLFPTAFTGGPHLGHVASSYVHRDAELGGRRLVLPAKPVLVVECRGRTGYVVSALVEGQAKEDRLVILVRRRDASELGVVDLAGGAGVAPNQREAHRSGRGPEVLRRYLADRQAQMGLPGLRDRRMGEAHAEQVGEHPPGTPGDQLMSQSRPGIGCGGEEPSRAIRGLTGRVSVRVGCAQRSTVRRVDGPRSQSPLGRGFESLERERAGLGGAAPGEPHRRSFRQR